MMGLCGDPASDRLGISDSDQDIGSLRRLGSRPFHSSRLGVEVGMCPIWLEVMVTLINRFGVTRNE